MKKFFKLLVETYNTIFNNEICPDTKWGAHGKCSTCHFNCGENCDVGTFYAEQGKTGLCIQGELWKKKEIKS